MQAQPGTLYVVATPIGNLGDITLRALAVLKSADIIAAEDTRHTRKLLTHHGVAPGQLTSYHDHNKDYKAPVLVERLRAGESVALVTDAGTPLIADPGYYLVVQAHAAGLPVVPLPGACAAATALSVAGLPTDAYTFIGYPPNKGAQRRRRFEQFREQPCSLVLYESPHRLLKCLADLADVLGERNVAVCRELTKQHEEIFRGTLAEAHAHFTQGTVRGEFTLVVEGLTRKARRRARDEEE
ncbi:MAG: 16S rRNA (cytidine(1402)-2'-O)-methyltransferase [Nitrospirae bacterium]|nr:16S rRNA (cytidine(1402)-2'-O)-methyltransferase [Nitrospirota bacterium]